MSCTIFCGSLGAESRQGYPRKYNALRVHCAWRVEHQDCWESYVVERSKAQKTLRRLREKGMPVPPWQSKIQEAWTRDIARRGRDIARGRRWGTASDALDAVCAWGRRVVRT